MSWAAVLALAGGTYVLKAIGPFLAGGRALPPRLALVVGLLPAALLAALVAVQTVGAGQGVVLDARLAGLAAGGLAVWRRAPFALVVVAGMAATALLRALGLP